MTDMERKPRVRTTSIQEALLRKKDLKPEIDSTLEGKWASVQFQTEIVPKKLSIGEMGRRHIQKSLQDKENEPKFYEKVTEEKINRLIVDYNSDVSNSDKDEDDRSHYHKKKRRKKTDQQTLVEGDSLTSKVDEFLKRFEPKEEEIVFGKKLFEDEDRLNSREKILDTNNRELSRADSQESLASGNKVLFGDWRICKDDEGDIYYWNVNTDETTWDKPSKPEVVVQSCYTQVNLNDLCQVPLSPDGLSQLCRQNLDKLNAIIGESPSYQHTPQVARQIELKTRYIDWRSGQLTNAYFYKHIKELDRDLTHYETNVLPPPGWSVNWSKNLKSYQYHNRITEETQAYYPDEKIPPLTPQKVIELD